MQAVAEPPQAPRAATRLLEDAPYEARRRFSGRERATEAVASAAFVAVAAWMAVAVEPGRTIDAGPVAALVAAYVVAACVPFHAGAGVTVPTQLVLVPLLFAAPAGIVPLLVAAALLASTLWDVARRRGSADRLLSAPSDAWHAIGPALVFAAGGAEGFDPGDAWLLAPALAAQTVVDLAVSSAREWVGRGIRPAVQLRVVGGVCALDALLTPIGLLAAWAAADEPYAALLALPLVGVLALLAHDRAGRIRRAAELSRANLRADAELASTRRLANTDALTGLANHRRLHELLAVEACRLDATQPPLALIMLDVDDFKLINDTHGHQAGDRLLRRLAEAVRASCRAGDEPARYGGEELAIVLPRTPAARAYEVAERIRAAIAAVEIELPDGETLHVTASLGVAVTQRPGAHAELLNAADAALYKAKRSGKDRTVLARALATAPGG